jgi:hypothetical protein
LVWQDALFLVIPVALIAQTNMITPLYIPGIFLLTFSVAHTWSLYQCGARALVVMILALSALAAGVILNPLLFLAISAFMAISVMFAVRKDLKKLPFHEIGPLDTSVFSVKINTPIPGAVPETNNLIRIVVGPGADRVGWPLAILAPRDVWGGISRIRALVIAAISFLYAYAILHVSWKVKEADFQPETAFGGVLIPAALIAVLGLIRLVNYLSIGSSPISLLGRIATGRFVISSYDRVWLAPFLAPLIALAIAYTGYKLIGVNPLVISSAFASGLFVLLYFGPSFEEWVLHTPMRINLSPKGAGHLVFRI